MIRHLLADLRWYRRVFLPSLSLIWRHRPRQGGEPRRAPASPVDRAVPVAGSRAVPRDGGLADLAAVAPE